MSDTTAITVGVSPKFNYSWRRAIEFYNAFSGAQLSSDRGIDSDKHDATFTVIGDHSDIEDLAEALRNEKGQIELELSGEPIFGMAGDYSSPILCNVTSKVSYPIKNTENSTLGISVRALNFAYDLTIPATLPELYYDNSIGRTAETNRTAFDTPIIGDYGVITLVDSTGTPDTKETAQVKVTQKTIDMARLQRFLSITRGNSFALTTSNIELFLNSTTSNVVCTSVSYSRLNVNFWEASLTLVKV